MLVNTHSILLVVEEGAEAEDVVAAAEEEASLTINKMAKQSLFTNNT
jgi:hypothetical protein